jgi:2-polyprenyl-3-methyl-5-hydroxy-6-metoxy-1,4-benzoquinol methylase
VAVSWVAGEIRVRVEVKKYEHDAVAAERRAAVSRMDKAWYRSAATALRASGLRGGSCLDLCCGNSEFALILRDDFEMKVLCADYVESQLAHARDLGFEATRVDFDGSDREIHASAEAMRGRFDLVVCIAAIEHIWNSDGVFAFCHAVLRPGGRLLVNTPNISFVGYRIYSLLSGNRPFGEWHHTRFWDFRFLRTNLHFNGFDVVADRSGLFAPPAYAFSRAFRGCQATGRFLAQACFQACRLLKRLPGGKAWFTDELTLVARRADVPPIGFHAILARKTLEAHRGQPVGDAMAARLIEARGQGWLAEHPNLRALADEIAYER